MKLESPECKYGYTRVQLERVLADRLPEFDRWMHGQTFAICDSREYDHDKLEYQPTGCGPHGEVVYGCDVRQFLGGGRPLD